VLFRSDPRYSQRAQGFNLHMLQRISLSNHRFFVRVFFSRDPGEPQRVVIVLAKPAGDIKAHGRVRELHDNTKRYLGRFCSRASSFAEFCSREGEPAEFADMEVPVRNGSSGNVAALAFFGSLLVPAGNTDMLAAAPGDLGLAIFICGLVFCAYAALCLVSSWGKDRFAQKDWLPWQVALVIAVLVSVFWLGIPGLHPDLSSLSSLVREPGLLVAVLGLVARAAPACPKKKHTPVRWLRNSSGRPGPFFFAVRTWTRSPSSRAGKSF
jgi:hypothetical protein